MSKNSGNNSLLKNGFGEVGQKNAIAQIESQPFKTNRAIAKDKASQPNRSNLTQQSRLPFHHQDG
jgi:hypothetical protein